MGAASPFPVLVSVVLCVCVLVRLSWCAILMKLRRAIQVKEEVFQTETVKGISEKRRARDLEYNENMQAHLSVMRLDCGEVCLVGTAQSGKQREGGSSKGAHVQMNKALRSSCAFARASVCPFVSFSPGGRDTYGVRGGGGWGRHTRNVFALLGSGTTAGQMSRTI